MKALLEGEVAMLLSVPAPYHEAIQEQIRRLSDRSLLMQGVLEEVNLIEWPKFTQVCIPLSSIDFSKINKPPCQIVHSELGHGRLRCSLTLAQWPATGEIVVCRPFGTHLW